MIKNEEFYIRIQKARDYYTTQGMKLHKSFVCMIQNEVFKNGDEVPAELNFFEPRYTKNMVRDVLNEIKINAEIFHSGGYFVIKDLVLI